MTSVALMAFVVFVVVCHATEAVTNKQEKKKKRKKNNNTRIRMMRIQRGVSKVTLCTYKYYTFIHMHITYISLSRDITPSASPPTSPALLHQPHFSTRLR
jgi:hypothetical protein